MVTTTRWMLATLIVTSAAFGNVQAATHIGQPPGQLVTLSLEFDSASDCGTSRSFYRQWPNGTLANQPFRVPNNKYLIITDMNWVVDDAPTAFQTSGVLLTTLYVRANASVSMKAIHQLPSVNLATFTTTPTKVGGSEQMTSGVRVGSGQLLCMVAISSTGGFSSLNTVVDTELNGYLVDK